MLKLRRVLFSSEHSSTKKAVTIYLMSFELSFLRTESLKAHLSIMKLSYSFVNVLLFTRSFCSKEAVMMAMSILNRWMSKKKEAIRKWMMMKGYRSKSTAFPKSSVSGLPRVSPQMNHKEPLKVEYRGF